MNQKDLFGFDGKTYEPSKDQKRLSGQMLKVWDCMKNGQWWTLRQLSTSVGGSEAGVSARIRDLRKPRFGSHVVERQRVRGDGLHEYRLNDDNGR